MLDPAGTSRTLTGEQAQQQAQAINAVCSTSGTFCQFTPVSTEDFTKRQTVNVFANRTEDNETVVNTSSVLVSATSSIGTTYSSEVSASFGQKDLFNVVAKQTFSTTTTVTNALQRTTTWSVSNTVRPNQQLITFVDVPTVRATGDFKAIVGNTTYNLTDISLDFIDPTAERLLYSSKTEGLT